MIVVMLLSFLSVAAYDFLVDGIAYNIMDGDKCSVVNALEERYSGEISIPSTVIDLEGKTRTVTEIGRAAFSGCSGLTSVIIPNSVTVIEESAFSGCSGLRSIIIPNSVTKIGKIAFSDCSRLTSVVIGTGVLSIGQYAFANWNSHYCLPNLYKIILLPNSVPSGLDKAFGDYRKNTLDGRITYVANDNYEGDYLGTIKKYDFLSSMFEVGGIRYVPISPSDRTCAAIDCPYSADMKDIVIGETVNYKGIDMTITELNPHVLRNNIYVGSLDISVQTDIPEYFAAGCEELSSITLGNTGFVGKGAFCNAQSLQSLTVGSTVTDIQSVAFSGSMSTSSNGQITLNNTGSIGRSAFENAKSLQTLTVGSTVTDIQDYAFSGSMSTIVNGRITLNNTGFIGRAVFKNATNLESAELAQTITAIGARAFSGCSSLTGINIPGQVKVIEEYTFDDCKALTQLDLPVGLKSIGERAFDAAGITSLTIPAETTELGRLAFIRCSKLQKFMVVDGSSDLKMDGVSFADCPLMEVHIGRNLIYPTGSSDGSPFYRHATLQKVTLTDSPTEVFANEFYGCTALKEVSIGDGVTKIGDYAFSGCSAIETFSFGANVASIGNEAFSDCTGMTKLYAEPTTPPVCGTQALDDINKWNCTLYVAADSKSAYQAADQWKEFFFVESHQFSGIADAITDSPFDGPYTVYDLNGILVKTTSEIADLHNLPTGLYIINGKKVFIK